MASAMWDRMLNFLGFEEEDAEPEPVVMPAASARDELARRRGRRARPVAPSEAARRWEPRSERQELIVIAPRNFDAAQEAADHLKAGRPVLLNLESIDRDLAQRLINFLSGSVYALNGEMHRVGSGVMAFVPQGVDVSLPAGLRIRVSE